MSTAADPVRPGLLAVGLNPAWQKTLFFRRLQPGAVNRAGRIREEASGKGINFAHAVLQAGGRAQVAQFAGGATGARLTADLDARGIPHLSIPVAGATRVCSTLLSQEDRVTTELIEPSADIAAAEFAALRAAVLARIPGAAGVAVCGTFPPGVPMSFAVEIAAAARSCGIPLLLDAYRGVAPVLEAGVEILKINAAELRELTGTPDLDSAAATLMARHPGTGCLAVTDGSGPARLFLPGSAWEFRLPHLDGVVNPIGAGDCTSGVFLLRLTQAAAGHSTPPSGTGRPCTPRLAALPAEAVAEAFREALACACASCLEEQPAAFSPAAARQIFREIAVVRRA